MPNSIIFHGTMGAPEINWFPWLASEMLERNYEVFVPKLPTPEGQNIDTWLKIVQRLPMNEETILVGHSSGATFILHLLATLTKPIKQAILVSPVTDIINIPEYDVLNSSFIEENTREECLSSVSNYVKSKGVKIDIVYGDNDPYVPIDQPLNLAKSLGIAPFCIRQGGHLNAESGYTEFPEILEIIDA